MSDIETVAASALFHRHADAHPGVEVWPDKSFAEGGWSYAWIVLRFGEGSVRILEYVRFRPTRFAKTGTGTVTTRWAGMRSLVGDGANPRFAPRWLLRSIRAIQ